MNTIDINRIVQAVKNQPEGGTISLDHSEVPTTGYFVASPKTQNHCDNYGMLKALHYAHQNGLYFGWWLDSETGKTYYDAVHHE